MRVSRVLGEAKDRWPQPYFPFLSSDRFGTSRRAHRLNGIGQISERDRLRINRQVCDGLSQLGPMPMLLDRSTGAEQEGPMVADAGRVKARGAVGDKPTTC
jgi:hypothetical protein